MLPKVVQEELSCLTFDHFPIFLEVGPVAWGPTPFRFKNMWLSHPPVPEAITSWWSECWVEDWANFSFTQKLKFSKEKLGVWNLEVFGDVRVKKRKLLLEIDSMDSEEIEGSASEEIIQER